MLYIVLTIILSYIARDLLENMRKMEVSYGDFYERL